jgi:uncharacterized protein (TIGR03000 family)
MFSVVLFAALVAGENSADFHFRSCYGGAHSCYGGCYGSCYGWSSKAYYGGCYGSACHGGCGGGYTGCCGGWGGMGCYGGGGGCWGAPYAGYGSVCYGGCAGYGGGGCFGGCGGYLSPAYGVPGPVIGVPSGGVPVGAAPAVGEMRRDGVAVADGAPADRARIIFKLPEGAKLFVEGEYIPNAEVQKAFRTPLLEAGRTYVYSMRVETVKDGETLVGQTTVNVRAGRTEEVDFTAVEFKPEVKVVAR